MTIFIAVLMFCGLVFVHEFGHFAAAKAVGIKVNEFSIGMGPLIFQRKRGETEYSLRAFPVGGYCKMEGEDEDSPDERAFNRQPAWARILVIVAGSFMNILATILVLVAVLTYSGSYTTTLDQVPEGYPAREAGLLPGDRIIAVDDRSYDDWADVVRAISDSQGTPIAVTVLRSGVEQTVVATPVINEEKRWVIGITPVISHSVLQSTKEALGTTAAMIAAMGEFLSRLVTGQASSADVVGPVGIVTIIGQQAKYGLINVVYLMAMISLNLGIVNLLPLPALDGGRLLFVLIRWLSGGRISDEAEARVHMIGMILLMGLMIFLVFKDTFQFFL